MPRKIQWKKVTEEQYLNEENVSRIFDPESKLFEQEDESPPTPGCFASCMQRTFCGEKPQYLTLLVKEGQKSGKVTISENDILGRGSFGVISRGKLTYRNNDGRRNKIKIAVKTINNDQLRRYNQMTDEDIVAMTGKEVRALTRCQHSNVIALHFVVVYKNETLIGMEVAEHGTLAKHMSKVPKMICMKWWTNIIDTINFCHERGVMHLDLKPDNILLDEDFGVKIADFGISEMVEDESAITDDSFTINCKVGTPYYMAPEMYYGRSRNGRKCDVWSLGVIMYEMLFNKLPFEIREVIKISFILERMRKEGKSQAEIRQYLAQVFDIDKVYFPPNYPIAPKRIICAMLNFDPIKRPNLDQIISLSWLCNFRNPSNCNNAETKKTNQESNKTENISNNDSVEKTHRRKMRDSNSTRDTTEHKRGLQ